VAEERAAREPETGDEPPAGAGPGDAR
jgi:hypothetical protein